MKKFFFTGVLTFMLIFLLCVPTFAMSFDDVASDFWANKEISWAFDYGLIKGTSSTTFGPDERIQRGQMIAILYRYAGSPTVEQNSVYSDVTSDDWYSNAAIWAVQNGIMDEPRTVTTTFDAEEPISRAEFCTMLLKFSIYEDTYDAPYLPNYFIDIDSLNYIENWAINWAYCHKIVKGTSANTFSPHDTLTRAAAAAMLYRYDNYVNLDSQSPAQVKAQELVEHYACPYPKMIEKMLINTYGYSEFVAENAVEAVSKEKWKPFAVSKAEEFFYYISPKQPSQYNMEQYLVSSLGFDLDVARYAIEVMDIPLNFVRAEEDVMEWVSLAELEDMLFSISVSYGTINLNYVTDEKYYLYGLPSEIYQGESFNLNFNGEKVEKVACIFFDDGSATSTNEKIYLSQYDLIKVGILNSDGNVSDKIKNGISQEYLWD